MPMLWVIVLFGAPLAAETPAESFSAFIEAVLADDRPEPQRRAAFERYFDFETWAARQQAAEAAEFTAEHREQLKEQWFARFLSPEFRERYRAADVRVAEQPQPQGDSAELVITMFEPGKDERGRFRVLMTRAGEHWRWHSIPRLVTAATPAEELARLTRELDELRTQSGALAARIHALDEERKRLEAEIAEAGAGDAPYSSPMTTARTVGRAFADADLDATLRAHVPVRRAAARERVAGKLARQSERLASWEPLDTTLREADRAWVRVRVGLWSTRGATSRIITLSLRKVADEWLIDEDP